MKTTVDLPDELLVAAKKRAAEARTTVRAILERGLRHELSEARRRPRTSRIAWVTAPGGLPPGIDVADRAATNEALSKQR
jgi:hypothetical protein